jgi:hypothetical protein
MVEDVNWTRLSASVKYTKRMPALGDFTTFIHAGKVLGEPPALKMFGAHSAACTL